MDKLMNDLKAEINRISAEYVYQIDRNIIEHTKPLISNIQGMISWFLEENWYGYEKEDYEQLQLLLLDIVKDIVSAIENEDKVLLHDALDYGLAEFLRMLPLENELEAV